MSILHTIGEQVLVYRVIDSQNRILLETETRREGENLLEDIDNGRMVVYTWKRGTPLKNLEFREMVVGPKTENIDVCQCCGGYFSHSQLHFPEQLCGRCSAR